MAEGGEGGPSRGVRLLGTWRRGLARGAGAGRWVTRHGRPRPDAVSESGGPRPVRRGCGWDIKRLACDSARRRGARVQGEEGGGSGAGRRLGYFLREWGGADWHSYCGLLRLVAPYCGYCCVRGTTGWCGGGGPDAKEDRKCWGTIGHVPSLDCTPHPAAAARAHTSTHTLTRTVNAAAPERALLRLVPLTPRVPVYRHARGCTRAHARTRERPSPPPPSIPSTHGSLRLIAAY